jgi:hypothetical protein
MIAHLFIALLLLAAGRALAGNWRSGALAATAWALAREITQAEYRWIERFGEGLRANMPWWGGLDPAVWSKADPWLDWLVPAAAAILLAAFLDGRGKRTDRDAWLRRRR